jgi:spore coat protein U-like protein
VARADCRLISTDGVSFGAYNVFAAQPNQDGVGGLQIRCQGGGRGAVVKLSRGLSNSFVTRLMHSGKDILAYNLYTSAARNLVWGDGSGGSAVMATNKNAVSDLPIFGSMPAGQDAAVGSYADNIVVSVEF